MEEKLGVKIVFWGTSEFALPALGALIKNGYHVVAVVTNPDEPVGRKQVITPSPVKVFAEKHGIPVFQPSTLKNYKLPATSYKPDLFIVAAYGKIIPKDILDTSKYGALNIHPSLLPRWRGPSPIQYTILAGAAETGVTVMLMDEKMDHGPIIESRTWKVESRITTSELTKKLARLGAELLVETLPKWLKGEITPVPQDEAQATYSKLLKKEDGKIDWQKSAAEIERMIRAFQSWPGTYTFWQRGKNSVRLEIEEAEEMDKNYNTSSPGFVWQAEKDTLFIQTGKGSLGPQRLRPEGKKSMLVKEFLHGYHDIIGAIMA